MKKEILIKRKKVLRKLSKTDYGGLIKYVKEIYLAKYQLKILMARKCSNLFFALLPLARDENGGCVEQLYKKEFSGEERPLIISNRALSMLKKKIQSGTYKKILLADDIIIHGRSLDDIYQLLAGWFKEAGITDYEIDIWAYAESRNGLLKDMESLKKRDVRKVCNEDEWRTISNNIVNILQLLGQPYTSYVPNMKISQDSALGKKMQEMLERENSLFLLQDNAEMKPYQVNSYVYVSSEKFSTALNCSVRIYECSELRQYIFVPMVMLKPITQDELVNYMQLLEDLFDTQEYLETLVHIEEDDILYRTAVYMISALWGWKFIRDELFYSGELPSYDEQEEEVNFVHRILKENVQCDLDTITLNKLLDSINNSYQGDKDWDEILKSEQDFKKLNVAFNDVYKDIYGEAEAEGHLKEFFEEFLYRNSELDEQRCKESPISDNERKRLLGYPMVKIAERFQNCMENWVSAVLSAIDYGKGSIVSRIVKTDKQIYYLSVIHAGEQNYKYFINQYFPFLYGLNFIEHTSCEEMWSLETCNKKKQDFLDQYLKYWAEKQHFYLPRDLDIMKEMTVSAKYGDIIANTAWYYFNSAELNEGICLMQKIISTED